MAKKNNKQAKFFCENCGSEVPESSKFCKKCGKFFSAVRCPKCGCTGHSSEFKNGCPQCGYAVGQDGKASYRNTMNDSSRTDINAKALEAIFSSAKKSTQPSNKNSDSSLPVWIYLLTGFCMLGVIFAVYGCLRMPA